MSPRLAVALLWRSVKNNAGHSWEVVKTRQKEAEVQDGLPLRAIYCQCEAIACRLLTTITFFVYSPDYVFVGQIKLFPGWHSRREGLCESLFQNAL